MTNRLTFLLLSIWAIIYPFFFVAELALVTKEWEIGIYKHLSFLFVLPLVFLSIFKAKKVDRVVIVFACIYLLYISIQAFMLQGVNWSFLYARLNIVFFMFFTIVLINESNIDQVMKVLFFSLSLSLVMFFILNLLDSVEMYQYTNRLRFSAGFGHAGKFAMMLLTVLVLALFLYPKNIFTYIFVIFCIVLISYSQTRNIQLVLILASLLILLDRYKTIILGFSFFIFAGMAFSLYMSESFFTNINALSSARLTWWALGFSLNFDLDLIQLFFGKNHLVAPLEHVIGESKAIFHFDNSYLEFFIRDGIFGLLMTIGAVYIGFNILAKKHLNSVSKEMKGCQIIVLVYFIFDSGLFLTGNLLFVVLWLISTVPSNERRPHGITR